MGESRNQGSYPRQTPERLTASIERAKAQILDDAGVERNMQGEIMPRFPSSFSQLYDYTDASRYGWLCCDNPPRWHRKDVNILQSSVDLWLEERIRVVFSDGIPVSQGSITTTDLIARFLFALARFGGTGYSGEVLADNGDIIRDLSAHPEDLLQLAGFLYDRLDEIAPAGYRFGAHPDDDTLFGFWPCAH